MTDEKKRDLSVSMMDANYYTLLLALPIIFIFGVIYSGFWGFESILNDFLSLLTNPFLFLICTIAGIFIHEYLHKVGWMTFGKLPSKAIEFGFQLKTLTPYAHALQPMEINAYRWGAVLPFIVLGVIPSIAGIIMGNSIMLLYGVIFIFAAGGDLLILWITRFLQAGTRIEDHPTRAGCFVLEE
jgi:hypothetical protein